MENLTDMAIFACVVKSRSFTAAAEQTGLSPSAVSKHVTRLEARLNARLLNRTTRQLSLTEAGAVFYEHCVRMLSEAQAAELAVSHLQAGPRGTVKLSVPVAFGLLHIAPAVTALLRMYPELRLDLTLDDKSSNAIADGFDIIIRTGKPPDSTFQARPLASFHWIVCASPVYLLRFGIPQTPQELDKHPLFACDDGQHEEWHFRAPDGNACTLPVSGRLRANNNLALREAVLADAGIAQLPAYIVAPDLQAGRLQALLGDYQAPASAIYALYPQNRHLSPKVRAVIDFFIDRFNPKPYWDIH